MSSPTEIAQKKVHYRIIHRLVQATASTMTLTLNPMSFPFDGLCRIEPRVIASKTPDVPTNKLIAINIDVSQPYSQSNFSSGDVRWNTARTLCFHELLDNTTNIETTVGTPICEAILRPSMTITFTVTDAEADGYTTYTDWTTILLDLSIKRIDM